MDLVRTDLLTDDEGANRGDTSVRYHSASDEAIRCNLLVDDEQVRLRPDGGVGTENGEENEREQ